MTKNILDEIIREQRDTALTDRYLKQKGLTEEYINLPNVNLYCIAMALQEEVIQTKDRKYLQQFCRSWLYNKGQITTKNKRVVLNMINYYTQKQEDLLLRKRRVLRKWRNHNKN